MRAVSFIAAITFMYLVSLSAAQAPSVPRPDSVFLEDLTWMEVRDAIAAGKKTVIIPTGGTEQNGPHMALGKHNYLVVQSRRDRKTSRERAGGASDCLRPRGRHQPADRAHAVRRHDHIAPGRLQQSA